MVTLVFKYLWFHSWTVVRFAGCCGAAGCRAQSKHRGFAQVDIDHYQRVAVALKETIRLMKEIDKSIVKWPME